MGSALFVSTAASGKSHLAKTFARAAGLIFPASVQPDVRRRLQERPSRASGPSSPTRWSRTPGATPSSSSTRSASSSCGRAQRLRALRPAQAAGGRRAGDAARSAARTTRASAGLRQVRLRARSRCTASRRSSPSASASRAAAWASCARQRRRRGLRPRGTPARADDPGRHRGLGRAARARGASPRALPVRPGRGRPAPDRRRNKVASTLACCPARPG